MGKTSSLRCLAVIWDAFTAIDQVTFITASLLHHYMTDKYLILGTLYQHIYTCYYECDANFLIADINSGNRKGLVTYSS